jgi:hypothetical protein
MPTTRPEPRYSEQLGRYARALALARGEMIREDLETGRDPTGVGIFVAGNVNKRLERLGARLEYLTETFDDLDGLRVAYVRQVPLVPYSTISGDADRFLRWLEASHQLTPERRDAVACQHACFAVEDLSRTHRPAHSRFQEILSVAQELAPGLGTEAGLRLYLNPIRVWSRLETRAMLDQETSPPAAVLFYAARDAVRSAVLDPVGCALVNELSSYGPPTLDEWAALTERADRAELLEFCRDLTGRGIVALG